MRRTPPDRADGKIVPTAARPVPAELREASSVVDVSLSPLPLPVPVASIAFGAVAEVGAFVRRRRASRASCESATAPPPRQRA